jgi:hypothetical protein
MRCPYLDEELADWVSERPEKDHAPRKTASKTGKAAASGHDSTAVHRRNFGRSA